jgi:hypothetical protein
MHLTLLSPRLAIQKNDFLGSGVPYWPVDLAYFAAFLKKQNHTIQVLDLFGMNPFRFEEKTDHYLQGENLGDIGESSLILIYAISAMSHQEILNLITTIKKQKPQIPIVIWENSQAVTAYALDHVATDFWEAGADFLICGEPYWNWPDIEKFIMHGSTHRPSNLLMRQHPSQVTRLFQGTPSYLFPAWELFPIENYWKLPYSHGPKSKRYLPLLTSKGCPYPCDFCVVPETNAQNWRGRPASEVVAEMLYLKETFKVSDFQIEDLNPTVNSKRWREICEQLIAANANIRYAFVSGTKAETVKLEDLPLYAQSGCAYLSISPESGSSELLKKNRETLPT